MISEKKALSSFHEAEYFKNMVLLYKNNDKWFAGAISGTLLDRIEVKKSPMEQNNFDYDQFAEIVNSCKN